MHQFLTVNSLIKYVHVLLVIREDVIRKKPSVGVSHIPFLKPPPDMSLWLCSVQSVDKRYEDIYYTNARMGV